MEVKTEIIKCFSKKHLNNDAVIYCQNCRIYMCNQCKKLHSQLFEEHILYPIDKDISNIFTGICNEPNHNCELEYFCEDHNLLCCSKCVGVFKNKGYGKHGKCKVFVIEDIKNKKKEKLNENIKNLEELNNNIVKQIEELKKIFDRVEKDKENVKLKLQKIYTQLRNIINEEEDKLIAKIDKKFDTIFFGEKFVKKCTELPKKIKDSLNISKSISKEWNENKLNYLMNGCINVEQNIEIINKINNAITKQNSNKIKINFIEEENKIKEFPQIIKGIGNLYIRKDFQYKLRECPLDLEENKKYKITTKNLNTVQKLGKKIWTTILCENELKKNKLNVWNIKILSSKYRNIVIGIVPSNFDINKSTYANCGWHICLGCSCLFSGPTHNYVQKDISLNFESDNITLVMDMANRKLSCQFKGISETILYENIPTEQPLFPAIFLRDKGDKVIINKISYRPLAKK